MGSGAIIWNSDRKYMATLSLQGIFTLRKIEEIQLESMWLRYLYAILVGIPLHIVEIDALTVFHDLKNTFEQLSEFSDLLLDVSRLLFIFSFFVNLV